MSPTDSAVASSTRPSLSNASASRSSALRRSSAQTGRLVSSRAPAVQLRQGVAFEQPEAISQQRHRPDGLPDLDEVGGLLVQSFEPAGIHLVIADREPVARRCRLDGAGSEAPPQPQDRTLDHLPPRRRRLVAVQRLGETLGRDRGGAGHHQRGEDHPVPTAQRIVPLDLTQAQNPDTHVPMMSAPETPVNGRVTALLPPAGVRALPPRPQVGAMNLLGPTRRPSVTG